MEQFTKEVTYRVIEPAEGNVLTTWDGKDVLNFGCFERYEAPYEAEITGLYEISVEAATELKNEQMKRLQYIIENYGGRIDLVEPVMSGSSVADCISGDTEAVIEKLEDAE